MMGSFTERPWAPWEGEAAGTSFNGSGLPCFGAPGENGNLRVFLGFREGFIVIYSDEYLMYSDLE